MQRKLKWYYGLLLFAVIGVLITAVIRVLTPTTIPVPQSPLLTQSVGNTAITYRNLSYSGETFAPPASLPVAQLQPSTDAPEDLLQGVITRYNLTPHPRAASLWISDTASLSYNPSTQLATLSFPQPVRAESDTEPTYTQPFPIDEAAARTQVFFDEKMPFFSGTTLRKDSVSLFEGGYDLHAPEDPTHAEFASLPFGWEIESLPVFIGSSQSFPAEVLMNRDFLILKVVFNPSQFSYALTPNQPIISVEEAVTQLNTTQQGILLGFHTRTGTVPSLTEITGGTLTHVHLEYRLDPNTNLIYPFYRFGGEVTTETGTSFVDIATPAIKIAL